MGHADHPVAGTCLRLQAVVVLEQIRSLHAPVPTSLPSAMLLWHCLPHHTVMQEVWPQRERSCS